MTTVRVRQNATTAAQQYSCRAGLWEKVPVFAEASGGTVRFGAEAFHPVRRLNRICVAE
jgi:hypothetical protein